MRRPNVLLRLAVITAIAAVASCSSDVPLDPGGPGGPGDDNDTLPNPSPSDTIPPAAVTDPEIMLSASGDTAVFTWTAPHDDTPDTPVHHYEIRFAFTRNLPPLAFWDLAPVVPDPPQPAAPGSPQRYGFIHLDPAKDLWVGIASYDSAGNRSPGSDVVVVRVPGLELLGRCIDAYSRAAIPGLRVRVISTHVQDFVTDANGTFLAGDLGAGGTSVQIETGSAATEYHRMSQVLYQHSDTVHAFVAVPVQPTTTPELDGMSLLKFLKVLTGTLDARTILAKWHRYPVRCYIPPYVNGAGVDYELESKRAAQRWMDRTGKQLFTFVSAPPDTGIVVVYRRRVDLAPLVGVTYHTVISDLHPIRDEIHIVNDFPADSEEKLYQVMMHELGHTIAFGHVNVRSLIMWPGQPLPPDISDDETNAVILHQALPTRIDMSIYDEAFP